MRPVGVALEFEDIQPHSSTSTIIISRCQETKVPHFYLTNTITYGPLFKNQMLHDMDMDTKTPPLTRAQVDGHRYRHAQRATPGHHRDLHLPSIAQITLTCEHRGPQRIAHSKGWL